MVFYNDFLRNISTHASFPFIFRDLGGDIPRKKPSDFPCCSPAVGQNRMPKVPKSVLRSWRFLGICAKGVDRVFIMSCITKAVGDD